MSNTVHPVIRQLRERRIELGIGSRELSRRLGYNSSYLSKIETGHFMPSLPALQQIADALKATLQVTFASRNRFTLPNGTVLTGVHGPKMCEGQPCCIHNPSDHHMVSWPLHWRGDRQLMERVCCHGVGHPDPDHMAFLEKLIGAEAAPREAVHGCDFCCEWEESVAQNQELAQRYLSGS